MLHLIENHYLRAALSPQGAELSSLYCKNSKKELIWQGDPDIWSGHSPLLFPVVGKLKGDQYEWQGKTYAMPKHGFARKSCFAVSAKEEDSITFSLVDSVETRPIYPFAFRLDITFFLAPKQLKVLHTVYNPSATETLPFSIGAHPGFNCLVGDSLVFEHCEAPFACRLGRDMLLSAAPEAIPMEGDRLIITEELFAADALIFQELKSRSVTLRHKTGEDVVRMDWFDAPVLGLWAKPGAPYVCVEPWYGVDDHFAVSGNLSEKPHIILLAPLSRFEFPVHITALHSHST